MSILNWLGKAAGQTAIGEAANAAGSAIGGEELGNLAGLAVPGGALSYALSPTTLGNAELPPGGLSAADLAYATGVPAPGVDDDGWDMPTASTPPPAPSPQPQQIGQGSAASPPQQQMSAQMQNQQVMQDETALEQGVQSQAGTAPQVPAANAPPPSAPAAGGGLDPVASAAALAPNPFLTAGPASAGFAPQLQGLANVRLGSAAVPAGVSDAYRRATRETPGRIHERGFLGTSIGGGWRDETPEEVATRIDAAQNTLSRQTGGIQAAPEGTTLRSLQDTGNEQWGDAYWQNIGEANVSGNQYAAPNANIATAVGDAEIASLLADPSQGLSDDGDDHDPFGGRQTQHQINAVGSMDAARGYSHGREPERESDSGGGGGGSK